jgi:hypothetical protein
MALELLSEESLVEFPPRAFSKDPEVSVRGPHRTLPAIEKVTRL